MTEILETRQITLVRKLVVSQVIFTLHEDDTVTAVAYFIRRGSEQAGTLTIGEGPLEGVDFSHAELTVLPGWGQFAAALKSSIVAKATAKS